MLAPDVKAQATLMAAALKLLGANLRVHIEYQQINTILATSKARSRRPRLSENRTMVLGNILKNHDGPPRNCLSLNSNVCKPTFECSVMHGLYNQAQAAIVKEDKVSDKQRLDFCNWRLAAKGNTFTKRHQDSRGLITWAMIHFGQKLAQRLQSHEQCPSREGTKQLT